MWKELLNWFEMPLILAVRPCGGLSAPSVPSLSAIVVVCSEGSIMVMVYLFKWV